MTTGNDLSDWMTLSGSRRQASKRAPLAGGSGVRAVSADCPPNKTKPTAMQPKGRTRGGPIDWIEFIRGSLFFGILGGVLWAEWVAIKSLAVFFSQLFGG
jgi:hypothetical protein